MSKKAESDWLECLKRGADELGVPLSDPQADQLLLYARELQAWNRRINLTAVDQLDDILTHHLLDSLAVAPFIGAGPVLDVGSGGGLPSLPLAIVRPAVQFTSIDSRNKKISFQRHAARALGLDNHHALSERVEAWKAPVPFAQIISRAFSSLENFAALTEGHLASGGQLLAMKGRQPDEELEQMPASWQLVKMQPLNVPGLAANRHLLIFERVSS